MLASPRPILRLVAAIAFALALAPISAATAGTDGNAGLARHNHVVLLRDGRSPDTKDAALNAHRPRVAQSALVASAWPPLNGRSYDGRSPDTKDAAASAHASTSR